MYISLCAKIMCRYVESKVIMFYELLQKQLHFLWIVRTMHF